MHMTNHDRTLANTVNNPSVSGQSCKHMYGQRFPHDMRSNVQASSSCKKHQAQAWPKICQASSKLGAVSMVAERLRMASYQASLGCHLVKQAHVGRQLEQSSSLVLSEAFTEEIASAAASGVYVRSDSRVLLDLHLITGLCCQFYLIPNV